MSGVGNYLIDCDDFCGMQLHFVHERSSDPNAIPLIFSHGWPGSFIEAFKIIRKLIDPGAELSFTVKVFCKYQDYHDIGVTGVSRAVIHGDQHVQWPIGKT